MSAKLALASETESETINAELNKLNAQILYAVQRNGKAYLSNTTISGKYALRACMVNFRTSPTDIDSILNIIREVFLNLDKEEF